MNYGNNIDKIPRELLSNPHWIMWKFKDVPGSDKRGKIPFYALSGESRRGVQGSDEDRSKLVTYDDALAMWGMGGYDGIGYCMLPDDGDIVAVDLDGCVTHEDGQPVFNDHCKAIMELNPGYWEFSPSGKGVHGFFKGKAIRWNKNNVETYQGSQFLTWTEDIITPAKALTKYTKIPGTDDEKKVNSEPVVEIWFPTGSSDDKAQAIEMLNYISPECSNETWVRVAMCLHHTFGDEGLQVFKDWSSKAETEGKLASEKDMEDTYYRMNNNSSSSPITFGSLIHMAKEGGWVQAKPDQENWRERLVYAPDGENGEPGKLMRIESNLELILKFDEKLPVPAYNELGHKHEMLGKMPWRKRNLEVLQPLRDDFAAYRRYINETYKVNFTMEVIENIFNLSAMDNSYNPVVDYLEGVRGSWDGVPRASSWLIDYLNVEDSKYTRQVGRLMLDALATRALYPGCKFDYVTIIEGVQGTRKSTLLQTLAKGYFNSDNTSFESKDSLAKLSRFWLIEMCELASLGKGDVESMKAMITRTEDSYRPPYAKVLVDVKRTSVFMGTTNDTEYLKDPTGNRRYLPIKQGPGEIDLEKFSGVVDQLWAEVMHNHDEKMQFKLFLSKETEAEVEAIRQSRTYEDPDIPAILEYLATPIPINFYQGGDMSDELMVRTTITAKEISEQVLDTKWSKLPNNERYRLNGILKSISFLDRSKGAKNFGRYGVFRYYDINMNAMIIKRPDLFNKAQDLQNKDALLSIKDCF